MYDCHSCHKSFDTERLLQYHLAFNPKHKDSIFDRDDFTCPECDEDFDTRSELQEHLEEDHTDDDELRDILSLGAGIVMGAIFGSELENEINNNEIQEDEIPQSDGDSFGGFSGGSSSGGGADSDW